MRKAKSSSYCVVVVDFSIVAEPQVGKLLDAQGLHTIQLIHNGQPVETKAAVGKAIDVFKAESIRAPVSDLHGTGALNRQTLIATKQSPYTTHFLPAEDQNREAVSVNWYTFI